MGIQLSDWIENICGKRRNCSLRAISPFPTMFLKSCLLLMCQIEYLWSKGLRNSNSQPDLLKNILSIYDQCHLNKSEVTLMWCPAYVGLTGNEIADVGQRTFWRDPLETEFL